MAGSNTVECPHCGARSVILAGAANKRWMCDACGGLIDLRDTAAPMPGPVADEAPAEAERERASRWMQGLTPEQQAAIRAELAADPDILRNEMARVRRDTTTKLMGIGARSPVLRMAGAILVLAGAFTAALPLAGRFFDQFAHDPAMPGAGAPAGLVAVSAPAAILLGLGLVVAGAALAAGRRWGAHASAILLVFACAVFQFHGGVVVFALGMILTLFLTRRALE